MRYGLVLPSTTHVAAWQRRAIDGLAAVGAAELAVVVAGPGSPLPARRGSTSAAPVALGDRLHGVPVERSLDEQGLVRSGVDVVVDLRLDPSPTLPAAGPDVWALRGPTEAAAAVLRGDRTTTVVLDSLRGHGPVAWARIRTHPHSTHAGREAALLAAADLPAQALRRALAGDGDRVVPPQPPPLPATARRGDGTRLAARWARGQLRGIARADTWHVGVVPHPPAALVADPDLVRETRWLPRPRSGTRYVADPWPWPVADDDGSTTVLVEDYDHAARKGVLAAYRLDAGGAGSGPEPVAELDVHLSYPGHLVVDGGTWLVPEVAQAGEVRAYPFDVGRRKLGAPRTLLSEHLLDPTVFRWDGRWWLFGTDPVGSGTTHLRAFWAEHPFGRWEPHAVDPLVIDVDGGRSAGAPLVLGGALHRVSQVCAPEYGSAVLVSRVDELTPSRFREVEVARVGPDPDGPFPDGLHTLNAVPGGTLVDAVRKGFVRPAARAELVARARVAATRLRRRP